MADSLPEQILASPTQHTHTAVSISSSSEDASVTSRRSAPVEHASRAPLKSSIVIPPSAQRQQEQMTFVEQHMAYAFPSTHSTSGQGQEAIAQAPDLRAELIELASQRQQTQQDAGVAAPLLQVLPLRQLHSRH